MVGEGEGGGCLWWRGGVRGGGRKVIGEERGIGDRPRVGVER